MTEVARNELATQEYMAYKQATYTAAMLQVVVGCVILPNGIIIAAGQQRSSPQA